MNNNAKILRAHQKMATESIKKMVVVMGVEALNHFKKSFPDQGFTDETLIPWQNRKREIRTFTSRGILTKTGRLRRSLTKRFNGRYAITISSNTPYANIHNEGGEIDKKERSGHILSFNKKGKFAKQRTESQRQRTLYQQKVSIGAHTIKMPKRKFVGYSSKLNRSLISKFDNEIKRIFK